MAINTKLFSIIGGCLLALACVFYIVSNAVPSWGKVSSDGYSVTRGLWKTCQSTPINPDRCDNLKCPNDGIYTKSFCSKVLTARAFVTLACILSAICVFLLFGTALVSDDGKRMLAIAGKGFGFLCLIMGIIGVAIAINVMTDTGTTVKLTWGASSIIGIIAIIINFVGAVASLFIS